MVFRNETTNPFDVYDRYLPIRVLVLIFASAEWQKVRVNHSQ